jgi:hypothetical protein
MGCLRLGFGETAFAAGSGLGLAHRLGRRCSPRMADFASGEMDKALVRQLHRGDSFLVLH